MLGWVGQKWLFLVCLKLFRKGLKVSILSAVGETIDY